jgi:hypothetical protein
MMWGSRDISVQQNIQKMQNATAAIAAATSL